MRIEVTYKGHKFTAVADFAGLDVECNNGATDYTMGLASELWNAIYETRLSLYPKGEEWDTTSEELRKSLQTMGLIGDAYTIEHNGVTHTRTISA